MGTDKLPSSGNKAGELLLWAARVLSGAGSSTPRLDAEVLLAFVLALTRSQLYARWEESLAPEQVEQYARLVRRRAAHEPVAYLIGQRAFYDVELVVDSRVLIPRPETEHLVEEALAWAQNQRASLRVLDVGTGSGALVVVLARHLPVAQMWAVDISQDALAVAAENVKRFNLKKRVLLVCGDLASPFAGPLDLVVANLPYIAGADMATLPPDVAQYEPHLALVGGEDGLDLVRRLLDQLKGVLARPGLLLLEIDPRQTEIVQSLTAEAWPEAEVSVVQDLASWPRVVRVVLA